MFPSNEKEDYKRTNVEHSNIDLLTVSEQGGRCQNKNFRITPNVGWRLGDFYDDNTIILPKNPKE